MAIKNKLDKLLSLNRKNESEFLNKIAKEYKLNNAELTALLLFFFDKYSIDNKFDITELQKYNRLSSLNSEINKINSELYKQLEKTFRSDLIEDYENNYYGLGNILETESNRNLKYKKIDKKDISNAVMLGLVGGLSLKERLKRNQLQSNYQLRSNITTTIQRGDGMKEVNQAIGLARKTDLNRNSLLGSNEYLIDQSKGQSASVDHAIKNGLQIEKFWIYTFRSKKKRDFHQSMDGQKADRQGFFKSGLGNKTQYPRGFGIAEEDINCRCEAEYKILNIKTGQTKQYSTNLLNVPKF